jgi:hypothetical protein
MTVGDQAAQPSSAATAADEHVAFGPTLLLAILSPFILAFALAAIERVQELDVEALVGVRMFSAAQRRRVASARE